MDDASSLRQFDAKTGTAAFWLYKPEPAYRIRLPEFTGTPMPKDEPMAANPPLGAYLDYTLRISSKSPVTLDILDSSGALVRHYSSADPVAAVDPAKSPIAPEWADVHSTLSPAAGAHRFVWSLHYPAPPSGAKSDPWADGLLAPPGDYRVVLTVDGAKQEQPLRVLADPRVNLPATAYAQQFALAQSIQALSTRVSAAAREAGALVRALKKARAPDKGLDREISGLLERAAAFSGVREAPNPHNAWAYPPRDTHNFKFLADALAKLQAAVSGADAAPSVDAQNGFKALVPMVDAEQKAWDELKSHHLAALNAKLSAAGKAPIDVK
jgi:hypothetical protein